MTATSNGACAMPTILIHYGNSNNRRNISAAATSLPPEIQVGKILGYHTGCSWDLECPWQDNCVPVCNISVPTPPLSLQAGPQQGNCLSTYYVPQNSIKKACELS